EGDAVADVAAGPCQAGGPVEADRGGPVAGDPDRPAPAVGDAGGPGRGGQPAQDGPQPGVDTVVAVVVGPDPGPEVVGGAASAAGDPAVAGALGVHRQGSVG